MSDTPPFPITRLRRLRHHPKLRDLVRETILTPHDFIVPLFVKFGENTRIPIKSMPGQEQVTVDLITQDDVENRQIRHLAFDAGQCLFPAGVCGNVVSLLDDGVPVVGPLIRIVFDDRDALCHSASIYAASGRLC